MINQLRLNFNISLLIPTRKNLILQPNQLAPPQMNRHHHQPKWLIMCWPSRFL